MTALSLGVALLLGLVIGALAGRLLARRDESALLASFQGLASQTFALTGADSARELAAQRDAVASLVAPLADQLGNVEVHLRSLEVERARAFAELREQVSSVRLSSEGLGRQTASLVDALRRPQARGRWGEVQLRRVVEYAGMVDRCDFAEQVSVATSDGLLRPDLVVRLAGGRCVLVDAKVTLAAYLEAAESTDGAVQTERMAAHARHLRQHVDRLADKQYWAQFADAPEFVVLFVPGEAFLAPALEHDPALLEYAFSRRVHLCTPTTLVSLLRTVAHAWQQQTLADDARAVLATGKELFSRLSTLGGHVDKLGRTLNRAVADYNQTVGSLERSVLPSARRMSELGLDDPMELPREVEAVAKPITAPHLVGLRDAEDLAS